MAKDEQAQAEQAAKADAAAAKEQEREKERDKKKGRGPVVTLIAFVLGALFSLVLGLADGQVTARLIQISPMLLLGWRPTKPQAIFVVRPRPLVYSPVRHEET